MFDLRETVLVLVSSMVSVSLTVAALGEIRRVSEFEKDADDVSVDERTFPEDENVSRSVSVLLAPSPDTVTNEAVSSSDSEDMEKFLRESEKDSVSVISGEIDGGGGSDVESVGRDLDNVELASSLPVRLSEDVRFSSEEVIVRVEVADSS